MKVISQKAVDKLAAPLGLTWPSWPILSWAQYLWRWREPEANVEVLFYRSRRKTVSLKIWETRWDELTFRDPVANWPSSTFESPDTHSPVEGSGEPLSPKIRGQIQFTTLCLCILLKINLKRLFKYSCFSWIWHSNLNLWLIIQQYKCLCVAGSQSAWHCDIYKAFMFNRSFPSLRCLCLLQHIEPSGTLPLCCPSVATNTSLCQKCPEGVADIWHFNNDSARGPSWPLGWKMLLFFMVDKLESGIFHPGESCLFMKTMYTGNEQNLWKVLKRAAKLECLLCEWDEISDSITKPRPLRSHELSECVFVSGHTHAHTSQMSIWPLADDFLLQRVSEHLFLCIHNHQLLDIFFFFLCHAKHTWHAHTCLWREIKHECRVF